MQLGLAVEFPPGDAGLHADGASLRIDMAALHEAQVEHHAIVADGTAGDVVTAAAHRDLEAAFDGEAKRIDDVSGSQAARDDGRASIDHAVVHPPRGVVAVVAGQQ